MRPREHLTSEEQAVLAIERIVQVTSLGEEAIEAERILQIGTTDKVGILHLLLEHLIDTGLATLHHVTKFLRYTRDNLAESQQERVFVAITERSHRHESFQEHIIAILSHHFCNLRMLHIKWHKPVAYLLKEGEPFHLRETAEIDVRPLLLHCLHLQETLLHLLHPTLLGIRVQDIFQRIILYLLDTILRHTEFTVIQQIGHNLVLYRLMVPLCMNTEDDLLLQSHEFLANSLVLQKFLQLFHLFREELQRRIIPQAECPADESPLSHLFVLRLLVDMYQRTELGGVEEVDAGYHHRAHQQLLVVALDGRRQQDLLHSLRLIICPDGRQPHIVKPLTHQLMVAAIYLFPFLSPRMLWLQVKNGHLRDMRFQRLTQAVYRPVAGSHLQPHIDTGKEGRVADGIRQRDVGMKHIQPPQQIVVKRRQLRVLEATLPIVRHQLEVRTDSFQTRDVSMLLTRYQIAVQRGNRLTEIPCREPFAHLCQYLVLYHTLFFR